MRSGEIRGILSEMVPREQRREDWGRLARPVTAEAPVFSTVPLGPGVYVFFDRDGAVLYVGKSKCLRKRLQSYFRPGAQERRKKSALRNLAASFAVEEMPSHFAALLREITLVQELAPRLNRQYRHPQRYAYFAVDFRQPFPRLEVRSEVEPGPRYFGPVLAPRRLAAALAEVADAFALRTCADPLPPAAEGQKCWRFQVKTCLAPCMGEVSAGTYGVRLLRALRVLTGGWESFHHWKHSLAGKGDGNPQLSLRLERRLASVEKARRMLLLARYQGDDAIVVQACPGATGAEGWAVRQGDVAARADLRLEDFDRGFARLWSVFDAPHREPQLVDKADLDRRWAIYRYLRSAEGQQWSVIVRGREREDVWWDVRALVRACAEQGALLPPNSKACDTEGSAQV